MTNQKLEQKIVNASLRRYNGNLAAVLIFGSYNTGRFIPGESDVDSIFLFKEERDLSEQEKIGFGNSLREQDVPISIIHFKTLKGYEEHIYHKGSWSSWITVICGSKPIYSTEEFGNFREKLKENPIPKEKLEEYLKHKDEFELEGYLKERDLWGKTKGLYSHFRRKLQIMNFYFWHQLEFDFDKCLENFSEISEKEKLKHLSELYKKRKSLSKNEAKQYLAMAKNFTNKVMGVLK